MRKSGRILDLFGRPPIEPARPFNALALPAANVPRRKPALELAIQ